MDRERIRVKALIECRDMARLIKEGIVRRCTSFELAEFIYNDNEFWHD